MTKPSFSSGGGDYMSKNEMKENKDIYRSSYKNYGRDLWNFLNVEVDKSSVRSSTQDVTRYIKILKKLREFTKEELIAMKQMLLITSRRHLLIRPLLKIIADNVKLLISIGLFSLVINSLNTKAYFAYLINDDLFLFLSICLGLYGGALLVFQLSIIYVEYKKKKYYVEYILPLMIDSIIREKEFESYQPFKDTHL